MQQTDNHQQGPLQVRARHVCCCIYTSTCMVLGCVLTVSIEERNLCCVPAGTAQQPQTTGQPPQHVVQQRQQRFAAGMQPDRQGICTAYQNAVQAVRQRLQQQQTNQLGNGTAAPQLLTANPPPRTGTSTPAHQYPQLLTVPEQIRPFSSRPVRAQQHTILSEGHLQQVLAQLQQDFGGEGYTEGMPQYQLHQLPFHPQPAPAPRPHVHHVWNTANVPRAETASQQERMQQHFMQPPSATVSGTGST